MDESTIFVNEQTQKKFGLFTAADYCVISIPRKEPFLKFHIDRLGKPFAFAV